MEQNIEYRVEQAYREYADALFRHAYFRCGNRDDARDIVQEVFISYTRYLTKGKGIDSDRSFLYQSVRNKVIDHFRKKKSASLDAMSEGGFDASRPEDSEAIVQQAENTHLLKLLDKLEHESYREVLVLRYVDGLEVQEIADLLNESANNISVRINRATEKLKALLSQQHED